MTLEWFPLFESRPLPATHTQRYQIVGRAYYQETDFRGPYHADLSPPRGILLLFHSSFALEQQWSPFGRFVYNVSDNSQ